MRPKRLISLLVAVCMMITMLPLSAVTAFAASASSYPTPTSPTDPVANDGTYWYAYRVNADNNNTATITDFLGPVDSTKTSALYTITVPTKLGNYNVTGLGEYSFSGISYSPDHQKDYTLRSFCNQIQSVTIPESVTSIGRQAFNSCDGLESLTIEGPIQSMGIFAFELCASLTTLSLGENIKTIGDYAFYRCDDLTNVTIPQSVTSIGKNAFQSCGLHTLTIEGPIESMGYAAFYGCTKLKTISFGEKIKTIGDLAFKGCSALTNVTIPDSVTSIGKEAFDDCTSLTTLSLGENIETIGCYAFNSCSALTNVTIPKKVKKIESETFDYCSKLEYIMLPAGLTSFQDSLEGCPACVIYYNIDRATANKLLEKPDYSALNDAVQEGHKLLCLCHVTFDAKGGTLNNSAEVPVYETEKIIGTKANDLTAIPKPTRAGYNFTGWYTDTDYKQLFNADETITKDITLYAGWVPVYHPLTVTGGIVTVKKGDKDVTDTLTVTTDETTGKKTYSVPDGATVTVTLDKTLIPEGMVFDIWSTGKFSLPLGQDYKAESITFPMSSDVDIAAQYRDATIEDDGPNVLGTAAIIGTAAVGTAVLGYQAYSLGAEFAGKLMALPYFPSNRSALAMMLWEDAGKPMPESELLYPDVGQEAQDMDLQHAARWAMENELIPDLNDEGTAPEEMKFFPANPVSKLDVLNAWQKAQELKNN